MKAENNTGASPDDAGKQDFSFNFSKDRYEPIDDRFSVETNCHLQHALATIEREGQAPRAIALVALDAARRVLEEISPKLSVPIVALECELRDLDSGGVNGPITARAKKSGRPTVPEQELVRRARIVLAFQWLQHIGKTPRKASTALAVELGCEFEDIEQLQSEFNRPDAERERAVLQELWQEVETEFWVFHEKLACKPDPLPPHVAQMYPEMVEAQTEVKIATEKDVIEWLKACE